MKQLLLAWVKGGKTNTAMITIVIVYILYKFFGIQSDETATAATVAILLGFIGQVHKLIKSEAVQNAITSIIVKNEAKEISK
jgi:hypothetical protein